MDKIDFDELQANEVLFSTDFVEGYADKVTIELLNGSLYICVDMDEAHGAVELTDEHTKQLMSILYQYRQWKHGPKLEWPSFTRQWHQRQLESHSDG